MGIATLAFAAFALCLLIALSHWAGAWRTAAMTDARQVRERLAIDAPDEHVIETMIAADGHTALALTAHGHVYLMIVLGNRLVSRALTAANLRAVHPGSENPDASHTGTIMQGPNALLLVLDDPTLPKRRLVMDADSAPMLVPWLTRLKALLVSDHDKPNHDGNRVAEPSV